MFMTGDFTDDEIVEELVNRGFPEDFARDKELKNGHLMILHLIVIKILILILILILLECLKSAGYSIR